MRSWKKKIKVRNDNDWVEEVSSKSTFKRYKLARNGVWVMKYLRSAGSRSCEVDVQTGLAQLDCWRIEEM